MGRTPTKRLSPEGGGIAKRHQREEWERGNQDDDTYEINPDGVSSRNRAESTSGILSKRRQQNYSEAPDMLKMNHEALLRKADEAKRHALKLHGEKIRHSGFEAPYLDPRVVCDRSLNILRNLQKQGFPCRQNSAWGSHKIFLELEDCYGRSVFIEPSERVTSCYVDNRKKYC
eukprot:TRINITY_DN31653_c0_g1_i1.p1 TRINITY_DN31653_c0_g1~~TRINITY_DN31653_c0_g1_i1.p1  ORF type:complete len:188 (+),score=29.52 TRINITY_DN31653_c0_g1_i1:47-565(+)